MKVRCALAVVLAGLTLGAGQASGAEIWSQPGDTSGNGSLWASQDEFGDESTPRRADNFSLGAATSLTQATWWGDLVTGVLNGFQVTIYGDQGDSQPLADISNVFFTAFFDIGDITQTSGVGVTQYEVGLPDVTSLDLAAGTYWFSVVADVDPGGDWGWEGTSAGDSDQFFATSEDGGQFTLDDPGHSLAFVLEGDVLAVVPLPPAIYLASLGLVGVIVGRKRLMRV